MQVWTLLALTFSVVFGLSVAALSAWVWIYKISAVAAALCLLHGLLPRGS